MTGAHTHTCKPVLLLPTYLSVLLFPLISSSLRLLIFSTQPQRAASIFKHSFRLLLPRSLPPDAYEASMRSEVLHVGSLHAIQEGTQFLEFSMGTSLHDLLRPHP